MWTSAYTSVHFLSTSDQLRLEVSFRFGAYWGQTHRVFRSASILALSELANWDATAVSDTASHLHSQHMLGCYCCCTKTSKALAHHSALISLAECQLARLQMQQQPKPTNGLGKPLLGSVEKMISDRLQFVLRRPLITHIETSVCCIIY